MKIINSQSAHSPAINTSMNKPYTDKKPAIVPAHVAIIMDGNGRWAKAHGKPRTDGHIAGVDTVRTIIEAASKLGISYLTLYAFSTENWNRPTDEVNALLHLIVVALERETAGMIENNVKLNIIGDIDRLPEESRRSLDRSLKATSVSTGLQVNLALSYSSRWEIVRAARTLAAKVADGLISPDDIDEKAVSDSLTTAGIPDPDLLIRTGGDHRISNFLLWQIAYSELFVTPTYWPDFTADEFCRAVEQFGHRERRFGLTSEQVRASGGSKSPTNS